MDVTRSHVQLQLEWKCSQWLAPNEFSYKAEVDFDGTYLAANLMEDYEEVFLDIKGVCVTYDERVLKRTWCNVIIHLAVHACIELVDAKHDLPALLACYAEDVTRLMEREVKAIEASIRDAYPQVLSRPNSKLDSRRYLKMN